MGAAGDAADARDRCPDVLGEIVRRRCGRLGSFEQRRTRLLRELYRKDVRAPERSHRNTRRTRPSLADLAGPFSDAQQPDVFYLEWMQPEWLPSRSNGPIVAEMSIIFSARSPGCRVGLVVELVVGRG